MYLVRLLGKYDDRSQEDSNSNDRASDVRIDFPVVWDSEPFHLEHPGVTRHERTKGQEHEKAKGNKERVKADEVFQSRMSYCLCLSH